MAVTSIAVDAGRLILEYYSKPINETQKEDKSPLTEADLASDKFINAALTKLTPRVPILSEESGIPPFGERRNWPEFWLVDPLDGTKEFIKKNGEFTVNIALIKNGQPDLGVVYAPAMNLLYYAGVGRGAWKKVGDKKAERIYSKPPAAGMPLTIVESRSHPSAELEEYLKGLKVKERVSVGSSLKFGYVAEGKADVYPRFGPTMEWDVAAGDCVFRCSGRQGLRVSGLVYNKPDLKNPNFVLGLS